MRPFVLLTLVMNVVLSSLVSANIRRMNGVPLKPLGVVGPAEQPPERPRIGSLP